MALRPKFHALLAALAAAIPAFAAADVVTLANGDRLTGKVLRLSADKLTLETAYAGKLAIERSAVASIEAEEEVAVLLEGERELRGARGLLPLPTIAFVNPTPEQSGIGVAYKGRLTLSSAHVRGNSESSASVAEASLEARARAHRWNLGLSAAHASEAGKRTASSALAQASFDRFVAERRFWYVRGSLERDRFAGIDSRATAGAGYGLQFRETERIQVSLRGGPEFVSLQPVAGPTERYPALGWGLRYAHKVLEERAELFHEHDGYWNLEDTGSVTVRSRSGVRLPLLEGLTANAQLNVDWENEPEPGREATDATLLLGLGYEW